MVSLALFSHVDIILKAHQQSFFQSSIRSMLCYIFDVYCSLLNITIDSSSLSCMSSVVPLHSLDLTRRLSPLSPSDSAVNCSTYSAYNPCSASSGQVSTAVYHVNDWNSEDRESSSQKMKHRKISSEEKSFGWDNMLVCIIQFFQGVMEVDEKNGETGMDV